MGFDYKWTCPEIDSKIEDFDGYLITILEDSFPEYKEILQPMENSKFKKGDKIIITDFGSLKPMSFTLNKPYKLKEDFVKGETDFYVYEDDKGSLGNGYFKVAAEHLTIERYKEKETLEQQLEKAKAEVKRLEEEIEESKIKIGDWVVNIKSGTCFKWHLLGVRDVSIYKKITDKELINKLNNLIK